MKDSSLNELFGTDCKLDKSTVEVYTVCASAMLAVSKPEVPNFTHLITKGG